MKISWVGHIRWGTWHCTCHLMRCLINMSCSRKRFLQRKREGPNGIIEADIRDYREKLSSFRLTG
jgi:hypothetical protein